jgi:hypothetical protein
MSESKLVTLIENLLKNPEIVKAVYETGSEIFHKHYRRFCLTFRN